MVIPRLLLWNDSSIMSNTTTDTKIHRYASKGARVRQMGFETGIHALPSDIKNQIDEMIKQKYPPIKILRYLTQKYPTLTLPSKSALYVYRKKHYTESLASQRPLLQVENQLDVDKVKLKSALLTQIKRFIALDLPAIRERWIKALEVDEQLSLPQTKDVGRIYMEAIKLSIEAVPKLNIELVDEVELEPNNIKGNDSEVSNEELDAKLARIFSKRIVQFSISNTSKLDNKLVAT